jgi:hypothetical protein
MDFPEIEFPKRASTSMAFVHLNFKALDSDYGSVHLYEWIDLFFDRAAMRHMVRRECSEKVVC